MKTNKAIEEILFRASKIGLLAGGVQRNELTETQRNEMNLLIAKSESFIGLTDKQKEKLDSYKTVPYSDLTEKHKQTYKELELKLTTRVKLTEKQKETLKSLQDKDNTPPELSQGAKTYIKEVWLWHEKGFYEDIKSKYTKKGIQGEEDAINLVSYVDGIMYVKNEKRVTKGNLTGECDINTYFKDIEARVIDDLKTSWNPKTFMASDLKSLYEWQGHSYNYLYNADIFRLRYCLVDCPPEVYQDEFKKFCWVNDIVDESLAEYKPLIDQFNSNFLYEDSGRYTKEERIKTFQFERDLKKEEILLLSIKLGVEYYKTIKLNMID